MRCPAHAALALSVARELGCALEGSDLALAELAAELHPGAAFDELEAVRAVCQTFGRGPALLLPDVLRARAGDPAGVAPAVAAAAQRAGLAIDVVAPRAAVTPTSTAARAFTLTLPLQDDARDHRVREHARLLARLN